MRGSEEKKVHQAKGQASLVIRIERAVSLVKRGFRGESCKVEPAHTLCLLCERNQASLLTDERHWLSAANSVADIQPIAKL